MNHAMTKAFLSVLLLVGLVLPIADALAADAPRIQVLGLFRDKAMVKVNGNQVLLKIGDEVADGVKLVRANARRAVFEINGQNKEFDLGSQVSTRLAVPKTAVVRIASQGGMYKTGGLINGKSVEFLVDTGATVIAMSRPAADRLQIQYRETGTPIQVSTASQLQKAWKVKLNSVTVGGITLHRVDGTVIDTEHDQAILLGMSFLNRVKFSQDQGLVVLEAKLN